MISRAYRAAQILSIDIVIGVVILLRFFCAQFQVSPGWEVYVLLGGAVWLIYTADHLRDAERSVKSKRERYIFHRRHRKALVLIALSVLMLITPLIFFIPIILFLGGLALTVFSFIYLLIQHKLSKSFSKELYVAIVYSFGILMVPMLLNQSFEWGTFILLFLLTFTNLIIFSRYEREEDEIDGFNSIATQLSENNLKRLILALLSVGLALSLLTFNTLHLYFFVGFSIYAMMLIFPVSFKKNHLYRTVGDGVFLLPILFEWL
ncbi:UbiA family prenyltransferase [Ekhidna sp.]|uniref:UbiA family prenyltransferase n=1 Tax=Ekhidna sp. TaxID=2608089 RepID=UPI0032F022AB